MPKTVNDPVGSSLVNYQGTLHLLEAARNNQVKRFVFASSAALYGDEPTLPKVETMCPVTLSPYAVDKLASEFACGMYTKLYGLETVCLRYFNVYGPRQDPSSPYSGVISIFTNKLKNKETPSIFGDGEQTRDFVFVSDVVEANMKAVTTENCAGQFFNVATGNKITLNDLLKILCNIYNIDFNVTYGDVRQGPLALQHQHPRRLGSGPPVPLPGAQRRDQHASRATENWMRAREGTMESELLRRRPAEALPDHAGGSLRLGALRQRPRVPVPGRP